MNEVRENQRRLFGGHKDAGYPGGGYGQEEHMLSTGPVR